VSALLAARIGLVLLLAVSGFAADQLRRGGLDALMRNGLLANLLGVTALWLRTDKPIEGRILWVIAPRHGITTADLLVMLPVGVATALLSDHGSRVLARLNRR
jgi:hypothetical protein